jgi:hypothetical protein
VLLCSHRLILSSVSVSVAREGPRVVPDTPFRGVPSRGCSESTAQEAGLSIPDQLAEILNGGMESSGLSTEGNNPLVLKYG